MSYRNDHDAAISRVNALESEVARLRKIASEPPIPPPPRRSGLWAALVLSTGGVIAALTVGLMFRGAVQAAPAKPAVAVAEGASQSIAQCVAAIEPVRVTLDEIATDPRGANAKISWLAKTGASCREAISSVATNHKLDASTRDLASRWGAAEDELGSRISMIDVYYGSDPYRLDGYATAKQLWHEYNRTRESRDDVLAQVKVLLADNPRALDVE